MLNGGLDFLFSYIKKKGGGILEGYFVRKNICGMNLSTSRRIGRGLPFGKLKAPSTAEGLEVHSELRPFTPSLRTEPRAEGCRIILI
jgi:hypothetical protein